MHGHYFIALLAAASSVSGGLIRRQAPTAAADCVTNSETAIGYLLGNMTALGNSVCNWNGNLLDGLTINTNALKVNSTCALATAAVKSCKPVPWSADDAIRLENAALKLIPVALNALGCLVSDKTIGYIGAIPSIVKAPAMVLSSLKDMNTTNTNFQNACADAVDHTTDLAQQLLAGAQDVNTKYNETLIRYTALAAGK